MKQLVLHPPMAHRRSEDFLREMVSLRLLQNPPVNASITELKQKLAKHVHIGKIRPRERIFNTQMPTQPYQVFGGQWRQMGVLECFLSSVIERQLRYLTYIGDGNTKKPGLATPLRKKLEPIFRELCYPELLAKCMHGQTI